MTIMLPSVDARLTVDSCPTASFPFSELLCSHKNSNEDEMDRSGTVALSRLMAIPALFTAVVDDCFMFHGSLHECFQPNLPKMAW